MKTEAQHIDKWAKDVSALLGQIDALEANNARLRSLNAELLAAIKLLAENGPNYHSVFATNAARAAIAKAEREA